MQILIIKTSSMGDVIHTLPALTDAAKHFPEISFDWVVEENFAEIPGWHSHVREVIPIAWRRWRKNIFSKKTLHEWKDFYKKISAKHYDVVIDAQGLIKSAIFARLGKGKKVGLDWTSAREKWASYLYKEKFCVPWEQHAIKRARSLFSQVLGYPEPTSIPDYGIDKYQLIEKREDAEPYLVFLHGTTWDTKHWPEEYWLALTQIANEHNYKVKLPWGNLQERERATRIAERAPNAEVLPKLNLKSIAEVLAGAKAIAAVDTGLAHLSAALDVPTVSMYGPTNPALSGALGRSQIHLSVNYPCAPCFGKSCALKEDQTSPLRTPFKSPLVAKCFRSIGPAEVWASLTTIL